MCLNSSCDFPDKHSTAPEIRVPVNTGELSLFIGMDGPRFSTSPSTTGQQQVWNSIEMVFSLVRGFHFKHDCD